MRCARCGGLMVREKFEDFSLGSGGYEFSGWRCLNCGAIVDSVIAAHRRITSSAIASIQAVTTQYAAPVPLMMRSKAAWGLSLSIWLNLLHMLLRWVFFGQLKERFAMPLTLARSKTGGLGHD